MSNRSRKTRVSPAILFVSLLSLLSALPGDARVGLKPPPSATAFLDTIGVNVHMAYSWTSYADANKVIAALRHAGINLVRDVFIPWDVAVPQFEALAVAGFKYDMVIPVIDKQADIADFVTRVMRFNEHHPGTIVSVEGPNEVNLWPVTYEGKTSIPAAADLQRALFAAVRSEPALGAVVVYNLALAGTDPAQFAELGGLAASADFANSHAYVWHWGAPREGLDHLIKFAAVSAPARPVVVTETGYNTLLADKYNGVPEDIQAIYIVQTYLEAFSKNVARTFVYELLDEKDDAPGNQSEQHFGLFRSDGSPKPAAMALHNLTTILREESKGRFEFASEPRVAGAGRNLRRLSLRKADGRQCLILWRDAPLLEKDTKAKLPMPSGKIRLNFGGETDIAVFNVLDSDVAVQRAHASRIDVEVGSGAVIVQFGLETAEHRN